MSIPAVKCMLLVMIHKHPAPMAQNIHDEQLVTGRSNHVLRAGQHCWVYIICWRQGGPSKVGVALRPAMRRDQLQSGNPYPLHIFTAFGFRSENLAYHVEAQVLRRMAENRLVGEWLNMPAAKVANMVIGVSSFLKLHPAPWKAPTPPRPKGAITREAEALAEFQRLMKP